MCDYLVFPITIFHLTMRNFKTSVTLAWLYQVPVTPNLFRGLILFKDAETSSA